MIKLYTAEHCAPCHKITDLIEQGRVSEDVEVVDVETEEGFKEFSEIVLNRGDAAVPSAYKAGQKCLIYLDEEGVVCFDCSSEEASEGIQPIAPTTEVP